MLGCIQMMKEIILPGSIANEQIAEIMLWFSRIAGQSSITTKQYIVSTMESTVAHRALRLLINPYVVFHLNKKSMEKVVDMKHARTYYSFFSLCDYLQSKSALTNRDIADVQLMINSLDEDKQEFAKAFLQKTLKLGMTVTTYNKCSGIEPIRMIYCMLANKYADHRDVVNGKEFTLTTKLDGARCICFKHGDQVNFYTRQGIPIEGLLELKKDILRFPYDLVFDGELLASDYEHLDSRTLYKHTMRIMLSKGLKSRLNYHVFDIMTLQEYEAKTTMPYHARRVQMETLFGYASPLKNMVLEQALYIGRDSSKIEEWHTWAKNNGKEGVMINVNDMPYQFKRTNALLKVKTFQTADLRIIDMKPGEGKYEGSLGCLIVDYKGNPVGVGTGYTDLIRDGLWRCKDELIGRVAEISYFEETEDESGKPSLRFACFEGLREKGKQVSYS